jgi:hypothetical protein
MKNGGRVGYAKGGKVGDDCADAVHKHEGSKHKGEPKTKFASGGKVNELLDTGGWGGDNDGYKEILLPKPGPYKPHFSNRAAGGMVDMHAGAGSGEGRLEQAHRQAKKG